MKKSFLAFLVLFFSCASSFAMESSLSIKIASSVLVPMEIYVGDTAELRCELSTQRLLLSEDVEHDVFVPQEEFDAKDFTLVKLELKKIEAGYELTVFFIPWKTGNLFLPPVELNCFPSNILEDIVEIHLPEVTVGSLSEKLHENEIRPIVPPVLVPGTIYVVYALIILTLVVLIFLVVLCIKFKSFLGLWTDLLVRFKFSRNYRRLVSRLKKIRKNCCSDSAFAEDLEKAVRIYLEKRFAHPFHSVTSSEIPFVFDDIFVGMLSPEQQGAVDEICAVLRRCDYIRYAPDVVMEQGEHNELIDRVVNAATFFEKEEK